MYSNIYTMNTDIIFDKYKAAGLVPFSFDMTYNTTTKKKQLEKLPFNWNTYEKYLKILTRERADTL